MPPKIPDLLKLAAIGRPAIDDYLQHVVPGGLARYRDLIQTGGKAGQSLFTHILDGVFVLDQLGALVGANDVELRCLFAAFSVHDLNKAPPFNEGSRAYNSIVTPENVAAEGARLGLRYFFPGFDDHLNDIVTLARLHQGHQAVPADGLNRRRATQYRLPLARLERLGALIRAADILGLVHDPDDQRYLDRFLIEINQASPEQRFVSLTHRLAENRGLLTNLIHNATTAEITRRFSATPVAYFPEGVTYIVSARQPLDWGETESAELTRAVRARLGELQRDELGAFIRGAPAGIKVDPTAFESGATLEDILAILANRAQAKRYDADWRARKEADLRADLAETCPPDFHLPGEECLREAELLSAYRILLDDHAARSLKRLRTTAWARIYDLIELSPALRPRIERANPFRRAYLLAEYLRTDFDGLYERILADARPFFSDTDTFTGDAGDFALYLRQNLTISFGAAPSRAIAEHLKHYIAANHRQCSTCSAATSSIELMKLNVPPSVGVQSFSNRLEGGAARDPKRNVCAICRSHFVLQRLAWVSHTDKYGSDVSTFYLHLFPFAYFSAEQIAAWWKGIEELGDLDTGAFYLDPGRYFREHQSGPVPALPVSKTKRNGIARPHFSEALGNTPTLAVHAPGSSAGEQALYALQTAAIIGHYYGCKVLLSRTAVPVIGSDTIGALFFDGAPRALRWLVPEDQVGPVDLDHLIQRLGLLHQAQEAIRAGNDDTNVVLELARAAADDPLAIYFVADRLIQRAERKGAIKIPLAPVSRVAPLLRILTHSEGRNPVEYLDQMARIAAENRLIGKSFKRNSLLDPFDTALTLTEQHPESEDRKDLRAALVEEIFAHQERIADDGYRPGRTKREAIKSYVNTYIDGLLAQDHHGDVNRLLNRARFLRSAYLFYLQEALEERRRARGANSSSSSDSAKA